MPPEPCRCARWSWRPIARVLQFGRATGSQYLSIKYTERLAEAEIDLSVGTVGDAYDNALAECVIGLFKTEVINQCGPWKSMREVEWETLKWVDWYNNHRLLGPIGYIPPAKAEEAFYANLNTLNMVAWSLNKPPSGKPGAVQNAETFLTGFDCILQIPSHGLHANHCRATDGYTGYNRLTKPLRKGGAPIRVAHCWAHARRKLKEVFDRDGSEIAAEGLRRIAEFYPTEAEICGVSPGQRLSACQARTTPLVATFGDWLQAHRREIFANPAWVKN